MSLTDPPILETQNVCLQYPDGTVALRDINFHVQPQQFVALLGANGSGKTSLIKILTHMHSPRQGSVCLMGKPLKQWGTSQIYQRIGVVMQNPEDQLFGATVAEDVAFGPRNLGLSEDEVSLRVEQSLAAVGAGDLGDRPVHRLSFGQQKRVCMAGVLAMQVNILILDEPTAGLDPAGEEQMINLLRHLNRKHGLTIIMATHAVDVVPLYADRIVVLAHGRALASGTPQEVFGNAQVLKQANLRLPYVAQLFDDVSKRGLLDTDALPLTVEAARKQLAKLLDLSSACEVTP